MNYRLPRRHGGDAFGELHQERGGAGHGGAGHGGGVEDHGRELSVIHHRGRQGKRLLPGV